MKILLHSHFPAGHAYPMQAVAQSLVRRGHEVVWLTSASNEARVLAVGATFVPTKAIAIIDEPLIANNETGILDKDYARLQIRLLAQAVDSSAVAFEADYKCSEKGIGFEGLAVQGSDRVFHLQPLSSHSGVVALTGVQVTAKAPETKRAYQLPPEWDEIVAHPRVVGITQGTLAMDPTSLIIPAIEALSSDPDLLLVVASPHVEEITSRIGEPPNVRFIRWIPYHLFLPQLCLLITNGGYGSITQALSHKVPLICAGQTEDKKDTAARVSWTRAGIDLKTDNPSTEQVRSAARTILDDPGNHTRDTVLGSGDWCLEIKSATLIPTPDEGHGPASDDSRPSPPAEDDVDQEKKNPFLDVDTDFVPVREGDSDDDDHDGHRGSSD
ncbi:UDP-glucosyltransferase yojK [Fusarium beomiforme]|uniref:UDP-glucosyltransferase yojK n=1 Tax=Fusarium beomiforme TaxID=44412 RepID=A0A9P5DZU1_9HYPO|nr:UDP-glucosyltransferase yojK [Fusarium beomiforme]